MISDFEFEFQNAQTNHVLDGSIETLFLATSPEYSYLSSSGVRETGYFGGDFSSFVPPAVYDRVKARMDDITEK